MEQHKILEKYEILKGNVETLIKIRGEINSLILFGEAGIGKTYMTKKILNEKGIDFKEIKGVISPLSLYRTLYENKKKFILFDDIASIIGNENTYSIFLNVLFGGKTGWETTIKRRLKVKIPNEFQFKGKIIIITNSFFGKMKEREGIIRSRCYYHELKLNYKDKLDMMYYIAEQEHKKLKKEDRIKLVDFIRDNTDESTIDFDLRTQQKIEGFYTSNKKKWENLAKVLLKKDENLDFLISCLKSNNLIADAQKEFSEHTGRSRRTFFRYKNQLNL